MYPATPEPKSSAKNLTIWAPPTFKRAAAKLDQLVSSAGSMYVGATQKMKPPMKDIPISQKLTCFITFFRDGLITSAIAIKSMAMSLVIARIVDACFAYHDMLGNFAPGIVRVRPLFAIAEAASWEYGAIAVATIDATCGPPMTIGLLDCPSSLAWAWPIAEANCWITVGFLEKLATA